MKTKRTILLGALAVVGIGCVIALIPKLRDRSESGRIVRALRGLPRERVASAVAAFVRAQKPQSRPALDTVSLRELVAGGFLSTDEAAPFNGMDITFGVGVDETRPQQIVARVPLRSGAIVVELADGSIQQIAPEELDHQEQK